MNTDHERFNTETRKYENNKEVSAFFKDILKVIDKHKLTIVHEDVHGAFEVVPANKADVTWLLNARFNFGKHKPNKIPKATKEVPKIDKSVKFKFYKPEKDKKD